MAGVSLSVVSSASVNRGGVPAWVVTPTVRGINEVDRKLSVQVMQSMWTYTPTLKWPRPVLSWQWKRDGVAISGANRPVYVTTIADLDAAITCTVTLTGEYGTASITTGSTFKALDFNPADIIGSFFTDEDTYSNVIGASTITTTVDLVALGVLKSSKTTGSMTGGSTTLTVASATGFTIGDQIIVETGGEAGAGAIGTKGVGGTWPALSYADATAMNADTSQVDGKVCWLESTGRVYYWNDAGNAWGQISTDLFYIYRVIPRALVATITNIVGTTFTLDTAAAVSTTNANVYFDCRHKLRPYTNINYGATLAAKRIYVSAGEYAFSAETELSDGMKDMLFEGDSRTTTLFIAPNGCSNLNFKVGAQQRSIFRKFGLKGNHKLNSWGRKNYDETSWLNTFQAFAVGITGQYNSDVLYDDIGGLDHEPCLINIRIAVDSFSRNCYLRAVAPMRNYAGWAYNTPDASNCGIIGCEVESDYVIPGIETFNSGSCYLMDFVGQNTLLAVNSSTDAYLSGNDITFKANSAYNYQGDPTLGLDNWTPLSPIFNLNTNIANSQGRADPSATVTMVNCTAVIEGMVNGGVQGRNGMVSVAPGYFNAMIKDCYFEMPDQQSASWTVQAITCDGDGMTVSGTRVVGCGVAGDRSIDAERTAGTGRVVDCIGEHITGKVKQRNMTNAEYIASGGT